MTLKGAHGETEKTRAYEFLRVFGGREVAKSFHGGEVGTLDLLGRGLTHLRRGTPVVLAGQEVDGTFGHVDLVDAIPCIKASEVEVEIAVENAICLARVHMLW